jgi:hypothetical protein
VDPKTQKETRRSPVSNTEAWRELSQQALPHLIPLRLVVFAVGLASAATLVFIKPQPHDFLCPLKPNRKGAWRRAEKHQGR